VIFLNQIYPFQDDFDHWIYNILMIILRYILLFLCRFKIGLMLYDHSLQILSSVDSRKISIVVRTARNIDFFLFFFLWHSNIVIPIDLLTYLVFVSIDYILFDFVQYLETQANQQTDDIYELLGRSINQFVKYFLINPRKK
jgi:hypothetical protein